MSNPHEPGRISVTLKQDGREGTWIVFHGSTAEIRSQIIEFFALSAEDEKDTPMFDLVNEATRLYKAAGNVSSTLGGRVIQFPGNKSESQQSGSAWDRTDSAPATAPEPEVDPNVARLTAAIENSTTVDGLKELYARNKAAFDSDADLLNAWKAKGKALSA